LQRVKVRKPFRPIYLVAWTYPQGQVARFNRFEAGHLVLQCERNRRLGTNRRLPASDGLPFVASIPLPPTSADQGCRGISDSLSALRRKSHCLFGTAILLILTMFPEGVIGVPPLAINKA
jgi:hypothetical protein